MNDNTPQWYFTKHDVYGDLSASTVADSFIERSIPNMATAIVREGIQNAMDARHPSLPADQPVRVRLTLADAKSGGQNDLLNNHWFGDIFTHLASPNIGLPEPPTAADPCSLLIFEDFGTTGLTGDYHAPHKDGEKNNFSNFLYHEGITGKGNTQRGSRGVGKVVFTMASRARTLFALTLRQGEDRPLLIGKSVLKPHERNGQLYGSGYYLGAPWEPGHPREPITDAPTITAFTQAFPVARRNDPGLSVVVPFLNESEDTGVTAANLKAGIISEYHYAILSGKLQVVLNDHGKEETFNADHLPPTGDENIDAQVDLARWAVAHQEAIDLMLRLLARICGAIRIPRSCNQ